MNKLLKSQIDRYLGENRYVNKETEELLRAIEESYNHFEHALIEANEMVKFANRTKGEFLANMSHELRTPLNAIIGYSEMLADELNEGQDFTVMTEDIKKIHQAGKHLLSLIEEILDLTKIESGKLVLNIREIDLKKFLDELVLVAEGWIEEKKNTFKVELSNEVVVLETDEEKLRQIMLHMLSNASKFTLRGSIMLTIFPIIKEGEKWVAFQVKDTGIGISQERLKSIFDFFSHVESIDQAIRLEGGVGIGLAISKRFCKALGGEISVESVLGGGSTFTVLLPVLSPSKKTNTLKVNT